MTRDDKIDRLMWQGLAPSREAAELFLNMFEAMREIEHEEAEEERVEHARYMSQQRRR